MSISAPSVGCAIFYWQCNIGAGQKDSGIGLVALGLCQCWGAAPAAPDSSGSSCRDSGSVLCWSLFCTSRHSEFLRQKLRLWPFPAGGGHARPMRKSLWSEKETARFWNSISVVCCLHPHLAADKWVPSTAGSWQFFYKPCDFWRLRRTTDSNVFVFQYTESSSDCNMNPEGTKSREANNHNSSGTAIKMSEFVGDSWVRRGKGAKLWLWLCCLVFISELCFGWRLPKACRGD